MKHYTFRRSDAAIDTVLTARQHHECSRAASKSALMHESTSSFENVAARRALFAPEM